MTKNELRKSLKLKLTELTQDKRLESSQKLSLNLSQLLSDLNVIQKKLLLGVFSPIQMEPLWSLECEKNLEGLMSYPGFEKKIDEEKMIFRKTNHQGLIKSLDFNIELLTPPSSCELVNPEILIIPGLGFTKEGVRLGRGKGHYDKYLSKHSVVKIGVAFEEQVVEFIPSEAHDEKMNYLVTDQNIYVISL